MIKKLRLISKFLTSQNGQRIIATHTLPNNSRNKANQIMKFAPLIEVSARNIFVQKHTEKETGRLVSELFFVSIKSFA